MAIPPQHRNLNQHNVGPNSDGQGSPDPNWKPTNVKTPDGPGPAITRTPIQPHREIPNA